MASAATSSTMPMMTPDPMLTDAYASPDIAASFFETVHGAGNRDHQSQSHASGRHGGDDVTEFARCQSGDEPGGDEDDACPSEHRVDWAGKCWHHRIEGSEFFSFVPAHMIHGTGTEREMTQAVQGGSAFASAHGQPCEQRDEEKHYSYEHQCPAEEE